MRLYSPLLKTQENDDGSLTVEGVASAETIDAVGETVLAAAMQAAMPDFFAYGTGNLREMHQLSAAGTVDTAATNDAGETRISATVVDPVAILKVKSGVYKGFSVGGKVLARDPKDRKVITKIRLTEISLVDRPANPDAKIEMWKADAEGISMDPETEGAATPKPATAPAQPEAEAEPVVVPPAPEAPAGEPAPAVIEPAAVELPTPTPAAPETPPTVSETALDPVAKADAPSAPEPAAPADPLARADAAVAALEASLAKASEAGDLAKGMYTVQRFADVISSLAYIVSDLKSEAEMEGDGSPVPAKLQTWLLAGVPLFKEMAAEEIDELVARVTAQKAEASADLAKAAEADALSKAERDGLVAKLAERDAALTSLAERVEPLTKTVTDLAARLAKVEAEPAPPKTAGPLAKAAEATPVSKEQDVAGPLSTPEPAAAPSAEDVRKALDAMPEQERVHLLTKAALSRPIAIGR